MANIQIRVGDLSYTVAIGVGLLDSAGTSARKIAPGSRCAIVTDTTVAPLFVDRLSKSLELADFRPTVVAIPAGEKFKTLEQAGTICDQMMAAHLDRHSFVVGLGGGVVGDISGFVAAIFQRGIPHIQIPTTLLAMVDSSIGGKTAVNTPAGKNLIGAFHHPSLVIDDVDVLKTLPRRELNQGFAEIIKHGVIADAEMFEKLAQGSVLRPDENASDTRALQSLIGRNIEIKADIVGRDELDRTGERALLNFGHTVGHAIERAGDYRQFLHGEAISLGMVAASAISVRKAGLAPDQREAVVSVLGKFELPTRLPPNFPREKILAAIPYDKKFEDGKVRFVLTPAIGSAHLSNDVTMEDIREAVEQL